MPEPFLTCDLALQTGALNARARFSLCAPWSCLFGPSGSGKSSILRILAGHLRPTAGSVRIGEEVLLDAAAGISIPPHRRPLRFALQMPWLFPGTVRDNFRYGVPSSRQSSVEDAVLPLFALEDLLQQRVETLSGGQRQRVSLARTVASALGAQRPVRLLLLDEPFTGLDLSLRNRLALELRAFLREHRLPVLSVTHDVPEALLLEAEVLRLQNGEITAQGPAAEVLATERQVLLTTLQPPG